MTKSDDKNTTTYTCFSINSHRAFRGAKI